MNVRIDHSKAGVTLVEVMIASGVFVTGMVVLMTTLIFGINNSKISQTRTVASALSDSVLEDLRGAGLNGILTFVLPFKPEDTDGNYLIEGLGLVNIRMGVVLGLDDIIEIPMEVDENGNIIDQDTVDLIPNPAEVSIELRIDRGLGAGKEMKFLTTTIMRY